MKEEPASLRQNFSHFVCITWAPWLLSSMKIPHGFETRVPNSHWAVIICKFCHPLYKFLKHKVAKRSPKFQHNTKYSLQVKFNFCENDSQKKLPISFWIDKKTFFYFMKESWQSFRKFNLHKQKAFPDTINLFIVIKS